MVEKRRMAACVEYCGVNYHGWQYQSNADTVQRQVEHAISQVANEAVRVIAAGRTDAGVHGSGQVIHFDVAASRQPQAWIRGVNTHLPHDISLLWTQPVGDDFHARFSAVERAYRYVILNRDASPAYLHGRVAWHATPLAIGRMRQAAEALRGRHDFSAFRAAGCQAKSPERTIRRLQVQQCDHWIWIDISADGFLQHMVRNIAGALIRIGEGRQAVNWAAQLLAGRNRQPAAATATAHGLYFTRVDYAARFGLPAPPKACRFW